MKVVSKLMNANKGKKLFNAGATFTAVTGAIGAVGDYKDARDSGHGHMYSAAKAGTEFITSELMGWAYLPYVAMKAAPSVLVGGAEKAGTALRSMNKQSRQVPFQNATFKDNQQAYTMRQAGMAAAENSRYNLQQSLMGNEANYLR